MKTSYSIQRSKFSKNTPDTLTKFHRRQKHNYQDEQYFGNFDGDKKMREFSCKNKIYRRY